MKRKESSERFFRQSRRQVPLIASLLAEPGNDEWRKKILVDSCGAFRYNPNDRNKNLQAASAAGEPIGFQPIVVQLLLKT